MHHLGEGVCADAVLVQIIGEFHSHIVPACMSLRQDKLRYREIILVTWRFPVVSRWGSIVRLPPTALSMGGSLTTEKAILT